MAVLGLLPFIALPLAILAVRSRIREAAWALPVGSVLWGLLVVLLMEAASAARLLRPAPLLMAWLLVDVMLVVYVWRVRTELPKVRRPESRRLLLAALLLLVAIELFVALLWPPNTWDSMTYHLARIPHWLQDAGLMHYPTSNERQIWSPAWSEYLIGQSLAVGRSDLFAPLAQWVAGLLVAGGTWLLAGRLGANRTGRWLAVLFAATVPMAAVQATSTQTDLAATAWVIVTLCATFLDLERRSVWSALLVGGAAGLAFLTKGTADLILAPFLVWWALRRLRVDWRASLSIIAAATLALAVNLPLWARNYDHYGSPIGPRSAVTLTNNTSHSLGVVVSNVLRMTGSDIASGIGRIDQRITTVIVKIHDAVGLDPSNASATFEGGSFVVQTYRGEDFAAAPISVTIAFLTLIWVFGRPRSRPRVAIAYASTLCMSGLVFAAVIKWQPWINRLSLPLLVLFAPLVGLATQRLRLVIRHAMAMVLVLVALAWLVFDGARPLSKINVRLSESRSAGYFTERPDLYSPYLAAVNVLSAARAREIGDVLGVDDWEYPLWAMLHDRDSRIRIDDARLSDWPSGKRPPRFDAIVCTDLTARECQAGGRFRLALDGRVRVLLPR